MHASVCEYVFECLPFILFNFVPIADVKDHISQRWQETVVDDNNNVVVFVSGEFQTA